MTVIVGMFQVKHCYAMATCNYAQNDSFEDPCKDLSSLFTDLLDSFSLTISGQSNVHVILLGPPWSTT